MALAKQMNRLHGSVPEHSNTGLKLKLVAKTRLSVQDAIIAPRPPESARTAEEGRYKGFKQSFRRPLNSARGRLETQDPPGNLHSINAGGPNHSALRRNDKTRNTGKGYWKESLHETHWGVDVGAQEASNPMAPHLLSSDTSRRQWAQDGRRKRFHRRHQTFSDINQYEHFNRVNAEATTPAAQRAVELDRQLCDGRTLPDSQKALLR